MAVILYFVFSAVIMERKFITHSQLGIEYSETLPDYLAEIFLSSEHEWLSNAYVMY